MAADFASRLVAWQHTHGRHDLPWQQTRDAYRIWLSEIMLQQTQVSTVIGYYQRFLARFSDVRVLAAAPLDDVLALWAGLGYYSRARNLHLAAQMVVCDFGGSFPRSVAELQRLPGVGRTTAGAIAAFAFGERTPILDGNVKRVLSRVYGHTRKYYVRGDKDLWDLSTSLVSSVPAKNVEQYTQGLMDLGATLCSPRKPQCSACPFAEDCLAHASGDVEAFSAKPVELAKPRKPRRVQEKFLLCLKVGEAVYLEQRPPSGIWPGLWSLPEFESIDAAGQAARQLGASSALAEMVPLKHSFTHFDLIARPLLAEAASAAASAHECTGRWVQPSELASLGVPALLAKVLQQPQAAPA
jgi:A/G-specific adenine glycosylase